METISLSKRGYTVLKRWVEVKFDFNLERAKEAQDDSDGEIDTHRFGKNWKIELDFTLPHHQYGCDDSERQLVYGDTCDKCRYDKMDFIVSLLYTDSGKHHWYPMERKSFPIDTVSKEMILTWLDWVEENKNKWAFCRCGCLATMNGVCDICYIHRYVRSEEEGGDCCVCHENDGRWIKQQCGHILHKHCFIKIKAEGSKRKCPLCRASSDFATAHEDCYDV
jgi:hypothetical protein